MHVVWYTQQYPENERVGKKWIRGVTRSLGVGLLVAPPLLGAGMLAQKFLTRTAPTMLSKGAKKVQQAAETLYPGTKNIPIHVNSPFSGGLGSFVPKVGEGAAAPAGIHLPSKESIAPDILAHEIGHSVIQTRLEGKPLGAFRQKIRFLGGRAGPNIGANLTPLVQTVGHVGIEKSNLTPDQKRKAHIGMAMVPAALHAPILASEAGASVRALRIIKKSGMPVAPAAWRLGVAGGTYLLNAGSSVPASLAFASGFRHLRKQPEQQ